MQNSDLLTVSPSALAPADPCGVTGCDQRATTSLTMQLGSSARAVRLCEPHCSAWAAAAVRTSEG